MTRPVHAALCALALAVGFIVGSLVSGLVSDAMTPDLPPCATGDSSQCYWGTDTMGNGQGEDVVTP